MPSVAGGICQVATTLFQPVFWAGYQLEERWWHLYWIPSYTSRDVVGLDATVDEDSGLDFKWINPTSDYVLIQASTSADKVTFALYGHKPPWKVQVEPPVISGRVAPDPTPDVQAEPRPNVTLVGSGSARDTGSVTAAVARVRESLQPAPAAPPAPTTYETANGQRTLADIRDELRRAGWGGGSDQDAVATYKRLADAAAAH